MNEPYYHALIDEQEPEVKITKAEHPDSDDIGTYYGGYEDE